MKEEPGRTSRMESMNIAEFSFLTFLGSMTAGFLGALTGLGGGVVIVPLLTLVLGVDIRYAIGASLVSVIATSCGAAAAYVKEGFSNIRLGMFLEMATTFGALFGAALAARISTQIIAVIFGMVLLYSAFLSARGHAPTATDDAPDFLANHLHLDGAYPSRQGLVSYHVHGIPTGFSLMFLAGTLSGLLGIGSGAVKVLAMDQAMRVPFKVSTTTSNFMIGVTAAASAERLSQSRLYRSGSDHAGYAGSRSRIPFRLAGPRLFQDATAPDNFCGSHSDPGFRNDL